MLKGQKGITLVALIITIIVLLILAGVTISLVLGENGILNHASDAGARYDNAANDEAIMMNAAGNTMDNYVTKYAPKTK